MERAWKSYRDRLHDVSKFAFSPQRWI